MCRSLEQMLPNVTLTMASVGSRSAGRGFSTRAKCPFSIYVYAFILVGLSYPYTFTCIVYVLDSEAKPVPLWVYVR